jgi:hypothetical protein
MSWAVRCRVLGLGCNGYEHAENLACRIPGSELVSIADPMGDRAKEMAKKLAVRKWTTNAYDILEDTDIDAVIVVTPTNTHTEHTYGICKKGSRAREVHFRRKAFDSNSGRGFRNSGAYSEIRGNLSGWLHEEVRSSLCGGETPDRGGRDRKTTLL